MYLLKIFAASSPTLARCLFIIGEPSLKIAGMKSLPINFPKFLIVAPPRSPPLSWVLKFFNKISPRPLVVPNSPLPNLITSWILFKNPKAPPPASLNPAKAVVMAVKL